AEWSHEADRTTALPGEPRVPRRPHASAGSAGLPPPPPRLLPPRGPRRWGGRPSPPPPPPGTSHPRRPPPPPPPRAPRAAAGRPRRLVLVAELAARPQPAVERPGRKHGEERGCHPDGAGALGPVVGVEPLDRLVEEVAEEGQVRRRETELDRPLVTSPAPPVVRIARGHRVLDHLGSGARAGHRDRLLDLLDDDVLPEGVHEVTRAARDDDLGRIERDYPHRVAEGVAPESTRRRDQDGVRVADPKPAHGQPRRGGPGEGGHGGGRGEERSARREREGRRPRG